ncbi:succinate dehydrogenase [ubiquinone] cytochrome b small subunit, mitochondrial [Diachasma alloeum]|uniref:Succinate dehydrogenase [ubiquinone] cytochrome b small subunit n=1 Tax=Diachasma alloeum TaxID=454923 RepID=A0A4E0RNB7_9HYME|nr:succinate dehydrogenase [ubiquinone] cytochrome b small subunit, mitochondrial [Diachasma alloeum]THK32896.1 cytochrome B small subunit, succinate dehydrogenase [Diachasma alloeum]
MAYLTRCQVFRGLPAISKIINASNSGALVGQRSLQNVVKSYSSLVSNVRKSGVTALRPFNQNSQKIGQALVPFANQLRASSTGDHVKLWQMERVVAAAFIVLLPGVLLVQNVILDGAFAALLVMHAHWGLEAIILDYARPAVVGPVLPKILFAALYAMSVVTLAGLLALAYNGPGVGGAVKKFWAIGNK